MAMSQGCKITLNAHFLCRLVLDITGTGSRQDGTKTSFPWADSVQVNNVFGTGTGGPYGMGMLWKVEGFFMINNYHMALINDNDFGLEQACVFFFLMLNREFFSLILIYMYIYMCVCVCVCVCVLCI